MSKNDKKDKDGIITDKNELEKLLKQRRPVKLPGKNFFKKLLEPVSCYLTGPPTSYDKPKKSSILDDVAMCYFAGPPNIDTTEKIDLSEILKNRKDEDSEESEEDY